MSTTRQGEPHDSTWIRPGRTLLVASTGGHLEQLYRLRSRFSPALGEVEWATFETGQSTHLLRDETVHYIPFVEPKDASGTVTAAVSAAKLLRTRRFTRVVSTGAAVAVPFLAEARALRLAGHYIESAARSDGPSLSGSLVSRIPGVRLYCQYPRWGGGRWQYRGAVFDGFAPTKADTPKDLLERVVVTFGTQRGFGFRRAVDRLVPVLKEVCSPDSTVLWQTGATDMTGTGVSGVESIPAADMADAVKEADVVISHSGIGSALLTLENEKCPVLLPRRHSLGEHTDDHQRLIAQELAARDLAVSVDASEVTAEDVLKAASMRAASNPSPPPFLLQPD